MKTKLKIFRYLLFYSVVSAKAAVLYVDANSGGPTSPYNSWATAAKNIQDAIDVSVANDEVVVTNGVYDVGGHPRYDGQITNRVMLLTPVRVHSINGPGYTIINGKGEVRCAYLTSGASLTGFTLTNGTGTFNAGGGAFVEASGGGVYCESTNAFISNCLIVSNTSTLGGGAYSGTLFNCTLVGNRAPDWVDYGGGAAYSVLDHCTLTGNFAFFKGGGADHCTLYNCVLKRNFAAVISGPSAHGPLPFTGFGNGGGASSSTLVNCILFQNIAAYAGGAVYECYLTNCTAVSNNTSESWSSTLYNCISYFNTGNSQEGSSFYYSCTTPGAPGSGNISTDPLLIDPASGDLHLQSNSPCINAGNNSFVSTGTDMDGNPRIINGTVDMGVYEFQGASGFTGFHAWLAHYSLATDGSDDFSDPDGDGMNNYQEWRAGTNPTNATSALRLVSATPSGGNVTVSWQSVLGAGYFLQRAGDLGSPTAFYPVATNLTGQAGTTSFVDTNAPGPARVFYRVGVQ